jgi:hypothetical protein
VARKSRYCLHCRRTITDAQAARGEFVATPFGTMCPECARRHAEPEAATPPAPEPGLQPEPKAEPKPEPKPEPKVEPRPEPKTEPKPEPKIEPKAEPRVETETVPAPVAPSPTPDTPPPSPVPAPPPPAPAPPTPEARHPAPSHDPSPLLTSIQQELEAIRRVLLFEKTSPWNVLAVVAQCVAACVFVLAVIQWQDSPQNLLLAAIVLQLMALTFFLKGK